MEFDGARADIEPASDLFAGAPPDDFARIKLSLAVKCPWILEASEEAVAGQAEAASPNLASISGSKKLRCGCLEPIAATTFP